MASRGHRSSKRPSLFQKSRRMLSTRGKTRIDPIAVIVFCAVCSAFPTLIYWIGLIAFLYVAHIAIGVVDRHTSRKISR